MIIQRREFLLAASAAALPLSAARKTRLGLVCSRHPKLARTASPEDPLEMAIVRDMVRKAIEYGAPAAGSLEAKIKPGSWVVIKPNIVQLRPSSGYRTGDITDFRVLEAVLEYVAEKSKAGRITVAEGGSYRRVKDPAKDNHAIQDGTPVDALSFDWGPKEFEGWGGTLAGMLARVSGRHPGKQIDYIDLSYDAVRDPAGKFLRLEVPRSPNGIGAFSARPDYYVTNTIRNCDFLISVPVMKVHLMCGITACLKNYVGTAPREAYGRPGIFSNVDLHGQHETGGRIDSFIVDLAAFHPPDYCVVDAIRGLQRQEHNNHRDDQLIRSNMIIAGEDPVAADTLCSQLMGFNPWDIEMLHMAQRRMMGTMDLNQVEVVGDDPGLLSRHWDRPGRWYGRCNRQWLITANPDSPIEAWKAVESPEDTLDVAKLLGRGNQYAVAARVNSRGRLKGYLWTGLRGTATTTLNGQQIAKEHVDTSFRIGQLQQPIELKPGDNQLVYRISPVDGKALLSVLITGQRNDGDTAEGLRWLSQSS
jgi:uncharacterized protein (DUF362 family)